MRLILYISGLITATVIIVACMNNKANADMDAGKDKVFQAVSLLGTYEGNLPCADCTAISTTLILHSDRTYSLHYIYVGKSDQQFNKTGNWKVTSDILYLDNEDYNYKIMGDKLNQLDLSGKEITGSLAGKYMLNKVKD